MRNVPPTPAESASPPVGAAIARLATIQHGVVSRAQLRECGLGDSAITAHCARGQLHRVHWGVYAVGHPVLAARGRWMGAVLAAVPGAVLSHAAAAALWELRRTAAVIVDVTVPGIGSRKRPGLRIHRARSLETATDGGTR
jgi:hypothetical protein